ncbi:MAG: hypothetical protein LBG48_05055 [Rickettsiales bacterium]|jgi:hypothetical protein|nr:hypothetical protein [Rickettsiales bacterium]
MLFYLSILTIVTPKKVLKKRKNTWYYSLAEFRCIFSLKRKAFMFINEPTIIGKLKDFQPNTLEVVNKTEFEQIWDEFMR